MSEDIKMTKAQRRSLRHKELLEHHGWKLSVPPSALENKDRAGLGGGLKCFRMVADRDANGNKKETQHRCGNGCVKGSFFCKKHGGGNNYNLVHGKNQSISSNLYRGAFKADVGDIFEAFLNDPGLLDLKPELSALKVCLNQYIKKLSSENKTVRNSKRGIRIIRNVIKSKEMNADEKWRYIKDFCARQSTLTDGESLDRILSIIDTTSRVVERIEKIQNRDEFLMTADGLKILFRCIIDVIRDNADPDTLKRVKNNLLQISTRTQGDLSKYTEMKQIEVDAKQK